MTDISKNAEMQQSCETAVSGSYCVRKHDLFALTYPKVAENLSKEEAERIKNEMQTKSIAESGCPVPVFFVCEV